LAPLATKDSRALQTHKAMAPFDSNKIGDGGAQHRLVVAFRFLASLRLAVILMVVLAGVLSVATLLEARHGTAYAHWFVYKSSWFCTLLALLGINIFCAAAIRYPWKRHQTGFVVTHAGLLVLLVGAIQSFSFGIEGQISLTEGETLGALRIPDRSQITARWEERPNEPPYEFSFDGGPVDWNSSQSLDFGVVDGVAARILRFYRHAKPVTEWVKAAADGRPLIKFRVTGAGGEVVAEHYLADEGFGDALLVGPIRLQLQRTAYDGMLRDFLDANQPPAEGDGLLAVYFQDALERVPVAGNVGKKVAIGSTGASLEIVEYLPNARPDSLGRFTTKGDQPGNPMLELRVYLPGEKEPLRQIAFAKDVLLNLDGVYARECPVKFRYRHPAIKPETAVEFLQTSDGKLHGRVESEGGGTPRGVVAVGDRIPISHDFELTVTEYVPRAERKLSFEPVAKDEQNPQEPAALVEICVDGSVRQVWLQRSDLHYGTRRIDTPDGPMLLRYGHGDVPLGFALKLESFHREFNPGGEGNAAFASTVRLIDGDLDLDETREISMNEPLTHRRFTFYQSGFNESGHGKETSVLNVAYDPGRTLKYAGSLMICLGIAVMFYMRAYFFERSRGTAMTDEGECAPPHRGTSSEVDVVVIPNRQIAAADTISTEQDSLRAA
jgi:hypothetical protein